MKKRVLKNIRDLILDTSLSEKGLWLRKKLQSSRTKTHSKLMEESIQDDLLLNEFELLFSSKIIICCADDKGKEIYSILKELKGTQVYAFCEMYDYHWKKKNCTDIFQGKKVIGLDDCEDLFKHEKCLMIMGLEEKKQTSYISTILTEYKSIKPIITWMGFLAAIHFNIMDERFSETFRNRYRWVNTLRANNGIWKLNYHRIESLMNEKLVMLYTPSKTGSASVYKSLLSFGVDAVHLHYISAYKAKEYYYFKLYDDLYKYWKTTIPQKREIRVISLVRDPIARSISRVFQNIEYNYFKIIGDNRNLLNEVYEKIKLDMSVGYGSMFEWFKEELFDTFNINIYDHVFDKDKGYLIIEKGNIKVLVLTLEKLDGNEEIIKNYCGLADFKLTHTNEGKNKIYRSLYKNTLNKIQLSDNILDFYYRDNKYMQFFYDDNQIELFRRKWSSNNSKSSTMGTMKK